MIWKVIKKVLLVGGTLTLGCIGILLCLMAYSCVHDEFSLADELSCKGPFLNMKVKGNFSGLSKFYLVSFSSPQKIHLPGSTDCSFDTQNNERNYSPAHASKSELIQAFPDEKEIIQGITECQVKENTSRHSGTDFRGLYFNPAKNRYYFELRQSPQLMYD